MWSGGTVRCRLFFEVAKEALAEHIVHWGTLDSRDSYTSLLAASHIAVSTAHHEFFGIAMLEAAHYGAYPLVPERLAYPELFPNEYRYTDDEHLVERLASLCIEWSAGRLNLRASRFELTEPFGDILLDRYKAYMRNIFM